MCHCITPQALLSALVGRAQREGYEPTREDLRSVLSVGCTPDEILSRFAALGGAVAEHVKATLERVPAAAKAS